MEFDVDNFNLSDEEQKAIDARNQEKIDNQQTVESSKDDNDCGDACKI
jgi:hypothetical protein